MSKLIPMDEAANILGMTVEQVNELRSNNEIFGYRDGSNWKFKMTELERVAGELDIKLNVSDAAKVADDISESFEFDLSDSDSLLMDEDSSSGKIEDLDSADYAEDSSVELFQSNKNALDDDSMSDIDSGDSIKLADSSIKLDSDSDGINLDDSGLLEKGSGKDLESGLKLEDSGEFSSSSVLDGDDELSFGSSSLSLASESSKKLSGDSPDLHDDEPVKGESSSDTGKMLGDNSDDELLMSGDDLFSDDLSLGDSASFEESAELSSDFEDSDLVLDDSDSSSEIMLEANESGINLSANDSGILLSDEPLELGGSDIDALELPEDEDMIVLEDAADGDASTLMQEDDFNLTPLEASLEEDDSSGSQVIALEDSEIYADDSASTILGESDDFSAQPAMLDDSSPFGSTGYQDPINAGMVPAGTGPVVLPEAPYTLYQVLSLGGVTLLLLLGGMVAYNLAQNMWMPEEQVLSSSVMNFFLRLTGMSN